VEAVRCGVAGLALSAMLATALPAQMVISGVVMDGLAGLPLAAATVQRGALLLTLASERTTLAII